MPERKLEFCLSDRWSAEACFGLWLVSVQSIVWAADGKGWYAATRSAATNTLLFVDPDGHATALRQIPGGYYTWAIPSPDGHHVAFLEYTNTNNVWMVENF